MEYPIWGVPPGQADETLLYTKATTAAEAERVKRVLEAKGCTAVRVQTLDLADDDVADQLRRSVRV